MIKYYSAPDIEDQIKGIASKLSLVHIDFDRVSCIRSIGSKSRRTIARCHAMSRIFQIALNMKSQYAIEIISENFDKLPEEEKTKTLIHELLHIPKSLGGGFRHHDFVNNRTVDQLYQRYYK